MLLLCPKIILILLHQSALFNLLKFLDTLEDTIVKLTPWLGLVLEGLARVVRKLKNVWVSVTCFINTHVVALGSIFV